MPTSRSRITASSHWREAKFDCGELAIVTYLQAEAHNKPYIQLPVLVVARAQHHTIKLPYGVEVNRLALDAIIDIAFRQKLIPRRIGVDGLFDDITRGLV